MNKPVVYISHDHHERLKRLAHDSRPRVALGSLVEALIDQEVDRRREQAAQSRLATASAI